MPDAPAKQTVQKAANQDSLNPGIALQNLDGGEEVIKTKQVVVFALDKEEYASNIADLREIIEIREIVPIPGAPDYIAGILNVRGQIVVVVNLEKRLSLKRKQEIEPLHIIIVEVEDNIFGVIVDEVTEVLRIAEANIKAAPAIISSKINVDYLSGVGLVGERLLLLLDFKRVLSVQELDELAKMAEFQRKKVVAPVKVEKKVDVEKKVEELVKKKIESTRPEPSEESQQEVGGPVAKRKARRRKKRGES